MKRSQTSELEPVQHESREGSVEVERKLSSLSKQYKLMKDTMDNLVQQQMDREARQISKISTDRQTGELVCRLRAASVS